MKTQINTSIQTDLLTPAQIDLIEQKVRTKLKTARIKNYQLILQNRYWRLLFHILLILVLALLIIGFQGWTKNGEWFPKSVGLILIIIGLIGVVIWGFGMLMYRAATKKIKDTFNIEFAQEIIAEIFKNEKYKNRFNFNGLQVGANYCNPVNQIFEYFKQSPKHRDTPRFRNCWNLNISNKDVNYDFGSSIMSYVIQVRNQRITMYEAWDYVTFQVGPTKLHTSLLPEKSGLFHKKSLTKEEISQGLESTEFEKMFEIDYKQDPVMLRRFLQPRIMANILDYVKEHNLKTPLIWIDDDKVTVCFRHNRISGVNDFSKLLIYFDVSHSIKKTCTAIIQKIIDDVLLFETATKWGEVFDIEKRYGLSLPQFKS